MALGQGRLTNAEIAKRLARSKGTVDGWLGGTRTPRAGDLAALADVLGVTLDDLLRGEEELTRQREAQHAEADQRVEDLESRLVDLELLLGPWLKGENVPRDPDASQVLSRGFGRAI